MKAEQTELGGGGQLDQACRQLVCELVGMGIRRRDAARHAGITPSILAQAMQQDPAFAEELRGAKKRLQERCLAVIREHARTSRAAAAWLSRRGLSLQPPNPES